MIAEVASLAQKYLADVPVIVLGAGATIPHGLPTMGQLAAAILAFPDVEPEGWSDLRDALDAHKDLEVALQNVALPPATIDIVVEATWKLVAAKDEAFLDTLNSENPEFPLARLFAHFLRTASRHVAAITTNYDRLVEYAANHVGAHVETGTTTGWLQRFDGRLVAQTSPPQTGYEGRVTLLKVHGSLDWFEDGAGQFVGRPAASKIPRATKPLVVTPGTSKYRAVLKDPFRTALSSSDGLVEQASGFLCIGYGFNDEHVQPKILARTRNQAKPIVVVTRTLSPAVRTAILQAPPPKFLMLEEGETGTIAYYPGQVDGVMLPGHDLWQVGPFLELLTDEEGEFT